MKRFFSTALARGLAWQLIGTLVGAGLVTGLRALMGLSITDKFFFTEPAWVLGAFFGVLFFLAGNGSVTDWFKWARGIDTPEHHEEHFSGWEKYVNVSLDHKVIGVQYTLTALALIAIGGSFALIFRTELAQSQLQFLTTDLKLFGQNGPQLYNTLMSLHGIVMIISILLGVAGIINYVVPLMLGAQDMAFPRLNAFSFWIAVPAAVLLLMSLVLGGFGTGWTGYPPLSARAPVGVQMFFLGVISAGWSSILGALNVIATVIRMRAKGMTAFRMPIFVWAAVATSIIALTATQLIGLSFQLVMFQRLFGMGFFDPAKGGNPVLFQHLFWKRTGLPPLAGSKKPMPNRRWNMTNWNERPINCVAVNAMMDVATAAQTQIGIRKAVMPLARIRITVAITFNAPRIDDQPAEITPRKNI